MTFKIGDSVEICKTENGISGNYYDACILEKIDSNKYLVCFDTCSTEDGDLGIETVESEEVRPMPPVSVYSNNNFLESDRVDAFVNGAWRVGTVARKSDSYYHVKLDCTGEEAHFAFHNVRRHLKWQNEWWLYPRTGSQTNQAKTSAPGNGSQEDEGGQPKNEQPSRCRPWTRSQTKHANTSAQGEGNQDYQGGQLKNEQPSRRSPWTRSRTKKANMVAQGEGKGQPKNKQPTKPRRRH